MSAIRKIGNDPKYQIFTKDPRTEREIPLGYVRCNFLATSFSVFQGVEDLDEEEIAHVFYESNLTGPKQPRKIKVIIPAMDLLGKRQQRKTQFKKIPLVDIVKIHNENRDYLELVNKQPSWDSESNSFVLNFRGRVLVSSVKNFQIVHEHDIDYICMQFGKVRDNIFNLDVHYPFSLFQAFGIALTSFDTKITSE
jgi:hypothetical protein